jgi:hypothetical protein
MVYFVTSPYEKQPKKINDVKFYLHRNLRKTKQQRTMSLNVEKNNKKMRAPGQVESRI